MANIRKTDVPVIDTMTDTDVTKGIGTITRNLKNARTAAAANKYALAGVIHYRWQHDDTLTQTGVARQITADGVPVSQTEVSKLVSIVTTCNYVVNLPDDADQKVKVQADNLTQFWGHHWASLGGNSGPTLVETCRALVGEDGESRATAIVTLLSVYGAPSSLYSVLTGTRFHQDDPRNGQSDDSDEGDDQGDEDEGDDEGEPATIDSMMATLWATAQARGMSASEFVALAHTTSKA